VKEPETVIAEAESIIEEAKWRGCCLKPDDKDKGKCHVFIDHEDRCQCGERRLPKGRELG
jgi:hypothetical protein